MCIRDRLQESQIIKVSNVSPAKKTNSISTKIKNHPVEQKAFIIATSSTGILMPHQQTTLHLKSTGTIEQLPIKEGQYVQKGNLIVALNDEALQLDLQQKQLKLEDAIVNKKDLLTANGLHSQQW